MANLDKKNVRYNIIIVLVYIIGIVLILRLFDIQIINGDKYLKQSNSRLTRETTIDAARGNILDCNYNVIAGVKNQYVLNIYRSKIETKVLNTTILNVAKVLESNEDAYINYFSLCNDKIEYKYQDTSRIENWLTSNSIDITSSAEQVFNLYVEKYELQKYEQLDALKIMIIRYGIEKQGYTSMKPYKISEGISEKSVAIFEEQNAGFPGIAIEITPIRTYLYGSLASHILGYVGPISDTEYKNNTGYDLNDDIGKTGIEYALEKYLKGADGKKQIDMSIDGATTGEYITKSAIGGNDVVLTIDARIQQATETALVQNIQNINNGKYGRKAEAKTGSAVVMNVKTGEIIAMCSYPSFEPELFVNGISSEKWNEYTQEGKSALIDRAIQGTYAPGSIFKMVSAVAGLETGVINSTEKIICTGIYSKWGNPRCWYYTSYGVGHGYQTVSSAIKNSCNCYFYEVGSRLGIDKIEEYATYFGLGQKTNIELPGESSGTLAGRKLYTELGLEWQPGSTLSAVIGQAENSFTSIQIAKYLSMLVNGGKKIDVTVIKEVLDTEGNAIDKTEIDNHLNASLGIKTEDTNDLNVSEENLRVVLNGMKEATEGGTATAAFRNFNIEVGGKTGSTEAGENINAWFVSFAPFENPEIAVIMFVENGQHGSYVAYGARQIYEAYFGLNEEIKDNKEAQIYVN